MSAVCWSLAGPDCLLCLGGLVFLNAETWMPLLEQFSKFNFVSNKYLCSQLGLGFSEIRQRVDYLISRGLPVVTSLSGYHLNEAIYIPSVARLQIKTELPIKFFSEIESTNSQMMLADHKPGCVIALHQTSGRGRRGKIWRAAPGCALMFSVGDWLHAGTQVISSFPIWIGIAVCQFLRQIGIPVKLKWPNDLWIDDSKIAGVLVETRGDRSRSFVVVGIGLNIIPTLGLNTPSAAASKYLGRPWSDDETAGLIATVESAFLEYLDSTPQALKKSFCEVSSLNDQLVNASSEAGQIAGIVKGIDELGQLCILTHNGLEHLAAGDVSIRPI